MDEVLEAPVIKYKDGNSDIYATECFVTQNVTKETSTDFLGIPLKKEIKEGGLLVDNDYEKRLYKYEYLDKSENAISSKAYAAICPDFLLN
jgi:hypothetical protein